MAKQAKSNIWIDGDQAGATLLELKKKVAQLNAEIKHLPRNSEEYRKKLGELSQANAALTTHRNQIRGIGESFGQAKSSLKDLVSQYAPFSLLLAGTTALISGIAGGVRAWYQNSRELEKGLSSLKAITGASAEDISWYKKEAIEMGKTSTRTAMEVVEAYKMIGSSKPELLSNKEALSALTKEAIILSDAADIELKDSVAALTSQLNQFGLGAESGRQVINALAAGAKEGSAEIADLAASTEKSGAAANAFNVTLEENIGALETLAEKSLKGEQAGTQLRNVFLIMQGIDLLPPDAIAKMESLGVNLDIVKDASIPFATRLKELSKIQSDGTAVAQVFGKENFVAGQTLLSNVEKVKHYTDAVTGTNEAIKQQKDQNDNLDGDLKKLSNTWTSLSLSFESGGKNSNILRDGVQALTGAVKFFADNAKTIVQVVGNMIKGFVVWKSIMIATKIASMAQNGELKAMATNFFKIKQNATEAGTAGGKMGGALKGVGWTALIGMALQFAQELYRIASGAAQAERNLAMLEATTASASERVNKRQENRVDVVTKAQSEINRQVKMGVLTEEQATKKREELSQRNKKMVQTDLDAVLKRKAATQQLYDIMEKNKKFNILGVELANGEAEARGKLAADLKAQGDAIQAYKKELSNANEVVKDATVETQTFGKAQEITMPKIKASAKEMKNMAEDLNTLAAAAEKMRSELSFNKYLDTLASEQAKELAMVEHNVSAKYAVEIEKARELSKEKGDIGVQAAEHLQALEILAIEEANYEKGKINEKYLKERALKEKEFAAEMKAEDIAMNESFEQALYETKLMALKANLQSLGDAEISERRKTLEAISKMEEEHQIKQLEKEFVNDQIGVQEYQTRLEAIRAEFRQQREDAEKASFDKTQQLSLEQFEKQVGALTTLVDAIDTIASAMHERRIAEMDGEKNASIQSLDDQLAAKTISEEEYRKQKEVIEGDYEEKKKVLQRQEDKRNKEIAVFNASIAMALGIAKAAPNPLAMTLAGIAGAAQIAAIIATPLPQYKDGGFNVTGAQDGKTYNAKYGGRLSGGMTPRGATLALVSENEPEYFVPGPLLRNPLVADAVGMVEAIRTNQFKSGGFTQSGATTGAPIGDGELLRAVNMLNNILSGGVRAYYDDGQIEEIDKQREKSLKIQGRA